MDVEEDIEFRITENRALGEFRLACRRLGAMKMLATGLFSEEEIDDTRYWLETYMCQDGEYHTGYSPNKIAPLLGVSGETVRKWYYKGKINGYRTLGGFILIPFEEAIRIRSEKQCRKN